MNNRGDDRRVFSDSHIGTLAEYPPSCPSWLRESGKGSLRSPPGSAQRYTLAGWFVCYTTTMRHDGAVIL